MLGASLSLTTTSKLQAEVLPQSSVAVAVTVVVPIGKELPEVALNATVALPQLSVALALKETFAVQAPAALSTEMLAGQVTAGATLSMVVMV